MKYGAQSDRMVTARAEALMSAVREDARLPEYLRSALFQFAVRAWARAEVKAALADEWLEKFEDPSELFELKPGVMRSPAEVARGFEAHAARLRSRLGMDPVAYAALSRDLGLAARSVDESLARAAAAGQEIIARRGVALPAARASGGEAVG